MKRFGIFAVLTAAVLLTGCSAATYEGFTIPEEERTLTPVGALTREVSYEDIAPAEKTQATFRSADGLCVIEQKAHYYDVTLDLEQGDRRAAGSAYAEAVLAAVPDYASVMEPYLYENIRVAFGDVNEGSFSALSERVTSLKASLDKDYQDELDGFAETLSGSVHGYAEDGTISYEEALTLQMVPDALRGTACSAVSLDGSRTTSGERITARILEWYTGSADQIAASHMVLHLKNGENTIHSISAIGMLSIITGYNPDGVLAGILDVGCEDSEYVYEGKTCYTFALRHALENCSTAREIGEYMNANCNRFTFCHNLLLSDRNEVCCAEDSVRLKMGKPALRFPETPLNDGLTFDAPGVFCIVNGYAVKGNYDCITNTSHNIVRWRKFEEWFGGEQRFSPGDFKSTLACESEENEDHAVDQVGASDVAFHVAIVDYGTNTVQVSFTKPDAEGGAPDFITVGTL